VHECWVFLKDDVWNLAHPELSKDEDNLFCMHSWRMGISVQSVSGKSKLLTNGPDSFPYSLS
jgi:hypothetical protein